MEPDELADNLEPLFEMICNDVPAPVADVNAPLQMLVTNLDYANSRVAIALGGCARGTMKKASNVKVGVPGKDARNGKVSEVFIYNNFIRSPVDSVGAGDICAIAGLDAS